MFNLKIIAAALAASMLLAMSVSAAEMSEPSEIGTDTSVTDTSEASRDSTTAEDAEPVPEKVQDIVYDFLVNDLELTPAAAAGIMGNVMIECTFDPAALAMDTNGLYSFGLMMWNGPRYEALKKWCADNGYEHTDPRGQLGYLKWELLNTEKAAYKVMKEIPNTVEGACRAAILWASEFERCTRTSFGLRIYYALNQYWPEYAGGTVSDTHGIYGYYYNVPENLKYGDALTLYGAVVSFSSNIKSLTAGVYTEDGELVTGKTIERDALVGNIGVIDRYVVFNKIPRGSYYYTITAVNEAGEYIVERHFFTVSDEPTKATLVKENEGYSRCGFGAYCPGHVFSDMPSVNNWAHSGIDYAVDAGLFEGKPGGIFAPNEEMSRAMFVTVLCRLCDMFGVPETDGTETEGSYPTDMITTSDEPDEPTAPSEQNEAETPTESAGDTSEAPETSEIPEESEPSTDESTVPDGPVDVFNYYFKDVPSGKWYTEAVYRAAAAKLVMGKSADTFAPNEALTRAQLATLMYRFAELCGADMTVSAPLDTFADGDAVPSWASDALSWAVAAGLVTGTDNAGVLLLDPMGHATRAQVAAIVKRFVVLMENGGVPEAPEAPETSESQVDADTVPFEVTLPETDLPVITTPVVTVPVEEK